MKRLLLSLLALCLFGMGSVFAQNEIIVGDMNDDGDLTVNDITELTETILGKKPQRTISATGSANVSDPASIAGTWSTPSGTTLVLNGDGSATETNSDGSPASSVGAFEYYPSARLLVLIDTKGNIVTHYTVIRHTADALVLYGHDGSYTNCTIDSNSEPEPDSNDYVDLGLPSGTLWATRNIGANAPEEYGDLFAWGETKTKSNFTWLTYFDSNPDNVFEFKKYNLGTGKRELEPEDDAAYVNWGRNWRIPTGEQMGELFKYCSWTRTNLNGTDGYLVQSHTNKKSIFLPAAGYNNGNEYRDEGDGTYWTRTLETDGKEYCALDCWLSLEYVYIAYHERNMGCSVRPVRASGSSSSDPISVQSITLNKSTLLLKAGTIEQISVSVMPENATNKEVTWTSSDESIATVTNGKVKALKAGTRTITATAADGSGVKATCTIDVTMKVEYHDYVDLGLPSGTLWAICNVGANSPEEYGYHFAWGEVAEKADYVWNTLEYCLDSKGSEFSKYVADNEKGTIDNKTELDLEDDAAYMNWGPGWRMPSKAQIDELRDSDNCTWQSTSMNGKSGYLVKSKHNNASIFLPCAGARTGSYLQYDGTNGYYWTRSLYTSNSSNAQGLYLYSNYVVWPFDRSDGLSVRPVRDTSSDIVSVQSITLSVSSMQLSENESRDITVSVMPENATNKKVKWTSSDESIATVVNGKVTALKAGNCTITATASDGSGVKATCNVVVTKKVEYHDYVDLGLPSGTLWAICNVGANSPEEYGYHFAWGEIAEKADYVWNTLKYCLDSQGSEFSKYVAASDKGTTDNKTELDLEDDAAYMNWGPGWRMPSKAQMDELRDSDNCTWQSTSMNGKSGYLVKSKHNNAAIFLPFAGARTGSYLQNDGTNGYYWTRSLYTYNSSNAHGLYLYSNYVDWPYQRCDGLSVRPVRSK